MGKEDKIRDPMPPPNATPEEIGEFWDTHSLADYWDETSEVEFQVNLKQPSKVSRGKDLKTSDEPQPDRATMSEDAANSALDAATD